MDLIHSTFQASFNARIERLAEQEANELRIIFRFFDTDDDGAVTADQVLRIFGLLGLEINPAYVRDLEVVYLAEFLKIVDSNVPVKEQSLPVDQAAAPVSNESTVGALLAPGSTPSGSSPEVPAVLDEEARDRADAQLWEEEWRALDTYRRGYVTHDELCFFLKSCFSPFPVHDLDRFLELHADPSAPEDSILLTKASFLRFRRDYTARARAQSEHSSDEEDDEGEGDVPMPEQTARAGDGDGESPPAPESDGKKRRATRSSSIAVGGEASAAEADVEGIVIDPNVVEDEFADEEDEDEEADDDDDAAEVDDDDQSSAAGHSRGSLVAEEDVAHDAINTV